MELAIAGGILLAAIVFAAIGWLALRKGTERARNTQRSLAEARTELDALVAREVELRAAELDRMLSRARADSLSALAEEERRIAADRRAVVVEREREAGAKLAEALAGVQRQVEERIRGWRDDLDRTQATLSEQVKQLGARQRELVTKLDTRLATESQRLAAASDEQKAVLARLRTDFEQAIAASVASVTGELDSHAAERRRALREVGEQLSTRELALAERISREESEATGRIQASFADVERRQTEKLERVVERASERFAEAAAVQFEGTVKAAREDAARRLGRELDRAVQQFAREAETVLAEQLAHAGDAGASRLEKKLALITATLERQRDEFLGALERRLLDVEQDVKARIESLASEGEAEREVLETRLAELSRRVDETVAALEDRLTRR
jgi:gas vesicle protein